MYAMMICDNNLAKKITISAKYFIMAIFLIYLYLQLYFYAFMAIKIIKCEIQSCVFLRFKKTFNKNFLH